MSEFLIPILHQLPSTEVAFTPAITELFSSETVKPAHAIAAPVHSQALPVTAASLTEIEALKKRAYEEAYAEGLTQGKQAGLTQVAADIRQSLVLLNEVEETFKAQCQQYIENLDTVITAIIFEAVLKIVGSEIAQPANRAGIIQQVIAQYEGQPMLQILVNPADIKTLKQALQHSNAGQAMLETLLYPDSKIGVAGCRIVFQQAVVNMDIHKQLQAFAQHLSEHIPGT